MAQRSIWRMLALTALVSGSLSAAATFLVNRERPETGASSENEPGTAMPAPDSDQQIETANDELAERSAIADRVSRLLGEQRFSELEALRSKYRVSKSRTPSGLWRLTLFYAGIDMALSPNHTDWAF